MISSTFLSFQKKLWKIKYISLFFLVVCQITIDYKDWIVFLVTRYEKYEAVPIGEFWNYILKTEIDVMVAINRNVLQLILKIRLKQL